MRSQFGLGKGAQVGIFKFEMSIRYTNGNVMFEVGLKSLCSGLKIYVWTPSAYRAYIAVTLHEITQRVSVEREEVQGLSPQKAL